MNKEILKNFLTNTDNTGRFTVTSKLTGVTYFVEPILNKNNAEWHHDGWGSYNPSTGNIEHKKGFDKHKGAIKEEQSLLISDNGFKHIVKLAVGTSPISEIQQRDQKYYDAGKRPVDFNK